MDDHSTEAIRAHVFERLTQGRVRFTVHAHQEMADENIGPDEILEALTNGDVLENYSEHKRGPCCLIYGITKENRPLHIVCTTSLEYIVIITVYEPLPPKWVTPTQRRPTT
ncbi:MAG: DUF4258 domain-containing protein [Candidatus Sumerlaeota bacterium]|nr:DUF4258 domain-containing protein [Candidatus Sumerlaeota bacterium]